ncbi:MAG: aminotransferase class I/II-fold pyridoxal phosphate-dependent enzyme, partial [Planctomycetes bacterium]|nr:aminotransferase class I/II-fold pyridoxal phosphate-dependent enzyme [Planctomycetota bacterium]
LSKWCGAGGWRLGTFTFPRELRWLLDAMASVASETYTSTSAPIQYAAVRAFRGGPEIERYLWRSRKVLHALGNWIADKLNDAAIRTLKPQGGFYLFPDFTPFAELLEDRGIKTSAQLCNKLLEEAGVAILPGSDFGRPKDELTARLAYVDFDGARAIALLENQGDDTELGDDFVFTHCPNVVNAINAICEWVKA